MRDICDNIKHINIHIIEYKGPRRRRERNRQGTYLKKSLNLGKEICIQVQETQRVPERTDPKKTTTRHTVIKMAKIKDTERILKARKSKKLHTRELS